MHLLATAPLRIRSLAWCRGASQRSRCPFSKFIRFRSWIRGKPYRMGQWGIVESGDLPVGKTPPFSAIGQIEVRVGGRWLGKKMIQDDASF